METTSASPSPTFCPGFISCTTSCATCSDSRKRLSVAPLHGFVSYFAHQTSCIAASGAVDALQHRNSRHRNGNSLGDGPAGRLGTTWCTPKFLVPGEVGDE